MNDRAADAPPHPSPVRSPYPAQARGPHTGAAPQVPLGFGLYVSFDPAAAAADGVSILQVVKALRRQLSLIAPSATSHATVANGPATARGNILRLVRLALEEPGAVREARAGGRPARTEEIRRTDAKVVIDTSRKRVFVNGENAEFTYKEFELLQALVLREGRTVGREEIIAVLWGESDEERPNERTIDVHVRRLRQRLGDYGDIVRTVRGVGYRFDRHADVRIVHALGPSPDRF